MNDERYTSTSCDESCVRLAGAVLTMKCEAAGTSRVACLERQHSTNDVRINGNKQTIEGTRG